MNDRNFSYLVKQHDRFLRHIDAFDTKIAQTIAATVLAISFIFDKGPQACSPFLFYSGLALLSCALVILFFAYRTKNVADSPNSDTYSQNDKKLKEYLEEYLPMDLNDNEEVIDYKANLFDISLKIIIGGLIASVVGFYV